MCFVFGALKIRDRIQTIPFKVIPKPPGALSTVGAFLRTSLSIFRVPIVRGETLRLNRTLNPKP